MPRVRRTSALLVGLLASALALPSGARALPTPSQHVRVEASLDPSTHVVRGRVSIRFVNESRAPVDRLVFHLYLNAFRDSRSVFARESGGQLRGVTRAGEGRIDVKGLRIAGEERLDRARTDLVPEDATQMEVPLAAPLAPGGSLAIEVDYESHLPPLYARTGYDHDFHLVAQFFPKLAKLEPDGRWASFPYHGNGEFYADFATYELVVDVPTGHRVASGGELVEERELGGRVRRRFVASPVHDVVFVSSPHGSFVDRRCSGVRARAFHPPGYERAAGRALEVACAGLAYYGRSLGPYPYPTLTLVLPPRGAEGGAGMEYPTFFVTAGSWLRLPVLGVEESDATTAHELAHQWFQGLVATNEVRYPFLDEGLASFATYDFLERFAPTPYDRGEIERVLVFTRPPRPASLPANAYRGREYAASVYGLPQALLESVARTWGRARIHRALSDYVRRGAFRHPTPTELYASFDRTYWPGFAESVLVPALERGEQAAFRVEGPMPTGDGALRFVVRRTAPLPFPTAITVDDGEAELERLPFGPLEHTREVRVPAGELRCVTVDPDRHLLLDGSRSDDRRCTARRASRATFFDRALVVAQALLGMVGP